MKTEIVLSIVQTIILIGGLILGIRQVLLLSRQIHLATKQLGDQLPWQKKQVTFEYINKYSNELKECNLSLQKKIGLLHQNGQQNSLDEMLPHIKDDKTRTELYELVAYFEHLALGIEQNFFDENIVKEAKINVVISTFYLIKPYLLYRRNETNRNIGGHFEKLVKMWEKDK